jgi:redox-sensing transcriptional repressor
LKAEIPLVAVPVDSAQSVADHMVEAGIKALWNFTPYRIKVREGIVVQNTSIYSHLAVMYNRLGTLK